MRRVLVMSLVAVTTVGVALVVADGTVSGRPNETARAPVASSTSSSLSTGSSTTTTTTRPRRGNGQSVSFVFGGDVHFEGGLRSQLDSNPSGMLSPVVGVLSGADVAMVNLETAIATGGTPENKAYQFRAPASAFEALRVAGVDVVSMANNHGRDFGAVGLAETLAAKQQTALVVLGIGANAEEAYRPWRLDVRGQRLAIFAATDVLDDWLISAWTATDGQPGLASAKPPDDERLLAAIRAARSDADTVVVYLHWGAEKELCPSARQRELAQALVDAGADIVVGSHTHRVMTGGRLGAAFVDYGLGNFVFYNEAGLSGVTGMLRVIATGRDVDTYEWLPARIRGGIPQLVDGAAAIADREDFASRRACAGLAP